MASAFAAASHSHNGARVPSTRAKIQRILFFSPLLVLSHLEKEFYIHICEHIYESTPSLFMLALSTGQCVCK